MIVLSAHIRAIIKQKIHGLAIAHLSCNHQNCTAIILS